MGLGPDPWNAVGEATRLPVGPPPERDGSEPAPPAGPPRTGNSRPEKPGPETPGPESPGPESPGPESPGPGNPRPADSRPERPQRPGPSGERPVPRREVVTAGPRGSRTPRPVLTRSEIDEQTVVGEAYVHSLMRSQLRAACIGLAALAGLLGTLPLVFALLPVDVDLWSLGITPAWAVLGILAYPVLVAIARWYVRRVERNERDFSDLVE
jgi:hypothetical protein